MAMFLLWNAPLIHIDLLYHPRQHDAHKIRRGPRPDPETGETIVAQKISLLDRRYRDVASDRRTSRSRPIRSPAGAGRHAQERAAGLGRQSRRRLHLRRME